MRILKISIYALIGIVIGLASSFPLSISITEFETRHTIEEPFYGIVLKEDSADAEEIAEFLIEKNYNFILFSDYTNEAVEIYYQNYYPDKLNLNLDETGQIKEEQNRSIYTYQAMDLEEYDQQELFIKIEGFTEIKEYTELFPGYTQVMYKSFTEIPENFYKNFLIIISILLIIFLYYSTITEYSNIYVLQLLGKTDKEILKYLLRKNFLYNILTFIVALAIFLYYYVQTIIYFEISMIYLINIIFVFSISILIVTLQIFLFEFLLFINQIEVLRGKLYD